MDYGWHGGRNLPTRRPGRWQCKLEFRIRSRLRLQRRVRLLRRHDGGSWLGTLQDRRHPSWHWTRCGLVSRHHELPGQVPRRPRWHSPISGFCRHRNRTVAHAAVGQRAEPGCGPESASSRRLVSGLPGTVGGPGGGTRWSAAFCCLQPVDRNGTVCARRNDGQHRDGGRHHTGRRRACTVAGRH